MYIKVELPIPILVIAILMLSISSCKLFTPNIDIPTPPKIGETNPSTGFAYTQEDMEAYYKANPSTSSTDTGYMDRLLSTPILIIFVVASIVFIAFGGFCIYRAKLGAAVACFITGASVIALPIVIIILFKALTFLLYVFCGLVVLAITYGLYHLWRKQQNSHKANISLVDNLQSIKQSLTPERLEEIRAELIESQCETTKAEVKKIKSKKKPS